MLAQTAQEKAKNLRYQKPISAKYNLDTITSDLYDIQNECQNVRWAVDNDNHDMLGEILGDEDDAYQFKMQFADLEADIDRMLEDLGEWREYLEDGKFDQFVASIVPADVEGGLVGWDSYEGDYFGILQTNEDAIEEARKRTEKMTKKQMLDMFTACMSVILNYTAVWYRYQCLKASMDIITEKNDGLLKQVTEINDLYERAEHDSMAFQFRFPDSVKELDKKARSLPDMMWIQ